MKRMGFAAVTGAAVLSLMLPALALACENHATQAKADKTFKAITIQEVVELKKAGQVTILDANSVQTRTAQGTIPGAVLLSSFNKYDVSKELPAAKDQKLVFYCANQKCTASHQAAERALSSGYTDVHVLPDGISGWKQAGHPVAMPGA